MKTRRRDVHRVHQHEPFAHAALLEAGHHLWSNVQEAAARGDIEPELLTERFHLSIVTSGAAGRLVWM